MNVYYSSYQLIPLKKANRLSSLKPKVGVYLKIRIRGVDHFADYFPHPELGDKELDEFMPTFKYQEDEYEQKIFHILLNEEVIRRINRRPFKNHQLWDGEEEIKSKLIKYKLKDEKDYSFLKALGQGIHVRLDANGLFTRKSLSSFLKEIPSPEHKLIEYLEDPMFDLDWQDLGVPTGKDFQAGLPHDTYIFKPNCEFFPKVEEKVIFSSYMGSALGTYHAYCELMKQGDLKLEHGIVTDGFYQAKPLFSGNYLNGFSPLEKTVQGLYQDLSSYSWKRLCSI